jgi:methylmalonyl-CoA mutase
VTFEEFEAVSLEQWQAKVEETTPLSKLSAQVDVTGEGGLPTRPLYDAGVRAGGTRASVTPWAVAQEYRVASPEALAHALATDRGFGLDAAWVRLAAPLRARAAADGDGVVIEEREHAEALVKACDGAALWLDAGANGVTALSLLLEAGTPESLAGGVLCDPLGALAEHGGLGVSVDEAFAQVGRVLARASLEAPQLRVSMASGIPYHDAGAAPSVEVGAVVATLIETQRRLADADVAAWWSRTVLRVAADSDVFVAIAKVRALRWLAERVGARWGVQTPAFIAVRTAWRDRTQHDPWVNMLRCTAEVFAAAAGGADEVAAQPFSEARGVPDDDARRWAVTTAHMLREESHLAAVADPAGGSGYVEALTRGIAERAWAWVQAIEREGGMAAALASGRVQADVAACAQARRDALATGRTALTGVSIFPQLDEPAVPTGADPVVTPARADAATHTVPSLERARLAEPFEALRDAAARHQDSTGHRPRAQLYVLGALREHRARLDFARNVVQVGGFGAEVLTTTDDVVPALAVLVASDERLASEGAAAIEALRAAGAPAVWVACAPRDDLSADGFLHLRMNLPQTLATLHDALEVGR